MNNQIELTDEDRAIFRRVSVQTQARLHKADRQDAFQIRCRANVARYGGSTIAAEVCGWERNFGALS